MAQTVLLVGTRKGLFVLESDGDRPMGRKGAAVRGLADLPRDPRSRFGHDLRGRCERVARRRRVAEHRSRGDVGALERGALVPRGRREAVQDLGADCSARSPVRRRRGARHLRVDRRRYDWSLLSTLAGQPGSEAWNDPANQPPGHLGIPAILPHPDDSAHYWAIVQGMGIFETTDDAASWTPRNKGPPRRLAARESRGRLLRAQARDVADRQRSHLPAEPRRHASAASTPATSWTEITEGLPTEFGFAAAVHPHDRDTFYVFRSTRAMGASCPRAGCGMAHARRRRLVAASSCRGCRSSDAHLGVLREGMAIDSYDTPGLYFGTSTGQLFASNDEGENWNEIASYLPAISSVEVAVIA